MTLKSIKVSVFILLQYDRVNGNLMSYGKGSKEYDDLRNNFHDKNVIFATWLLKLWQFYNRKIPDKATSDSLASVPHEQLDLWFLWWWNICRAYLFSEQVISHS